MNKFMKKAMAVSLTLAMIFSLTACGEKNQPSKTGGSSGKGRIAYIVGALGDKSFSDSGEEGMKVLRKEGWDCKTVEAGDETKADKWEDTILDTMDEGYEYIVASSTFRDVLLKLAKEYPDHKFILFDDLMEESEIPENVAIIFYAQNEGSYMVGQLAAGMSKSKVVAVNVGMDNPVIADFVTGFVEGVKNYDPNCKVVKATVGSWTDPAKMKELCLTQARDKKADVFYQVAGGSGGGLFEACKETGTWAIGVDSDQYSYYKESENPELADVILTSMLKNVGDSFVSLFHDIDAGKDVWKKVNRLGLAENSVGYVENDFFVKNVPEEIRTKMKETQDKIISGEIKVKSYYDFANESEYQSLLDSVTP
ncbi:MAG: BMP family ABC transporter substrate-binding protein [Epulopiscium sp.]|nr:BMP family ABC transporter substrate-binding protein [Candidatus Epulonipiscium sp.]